MKAAIQFVGEVESRSLERVRAPEKTGNGDSARDSAFFEYAQGRRMTVLSQGASNWDITIECGIVFPAKIDAMAGDCPVFCGCCTGNLVQTLCCSCCCKKWRCRLFSEEKHLVEDAVCDFEFAHLGQRNLGSVAQE